MCFFLRASNGTSLSLSRWLLRNTKSPDNPLRTLSNFSATDIATCSRDLIEKASRLLQSVPFPSPASPPRPQDEEGLVPITVSGQTTVSCGHINDQANANTTHSLDLGFCATRAVLFQALKQDWNNSLMTEILLHLCILPISFDVNSQ